MRQGPSSRSVVRYGTGMDLPSLKVYENLTAKGVENLHHANTVLTACQFLRVRTLLSRGTLESRGLKQNPAASAPRTVDRKRSCLTALYRFLGLEATPPKNRLFSSRVCFWYVNYPDRVLNVPRSFTCGTTFWPQHAGYFARTVAVTTPTPHLLIRH